jgi:hypothetical protein
MSKDDLKTDNTPSVFNLDYSLIDNIQFEGIDHSDAPDYCDAYIVSADYDGVAMTEEQIELLNEDTDFVYEKLMDYIY